MSTRSRLVLGSLAGALAIHVALLSCTGSSVVGNGTPDAIATADAGGAVDHDGGLLDVVMSAFDAVQDAVRDVAAKVVDGEVRDAHAGGDAGTGCTCELPAYDSSFSLTYDTGGGPQAPRADYATGAVGASPNLVNNAPVVALSGYANYFDASGARYELSCAVNVLPDRSLAPSARVGCSVQLYAPNGRAVANGSYSTDATAANVVVTLLTDTSVEFRLPAVPAVTLLPVGGADAGVSTIAFANVVFRATAPASHFLAPVSQYRP